MMGYRYEDDAIIVFRVLGDDLFDTPRIVMLTASYWTLYELQLEMLGIDHNGKDITPLRHEILAVYHGVPETEIMRVMPHTSPAWRDPDDQEEGD